jgi:hypothetical protein
MASSPRKKTHKRKLGSDASMEIRRNLRKGQAGIVFMAEGKVWSREETMELISIYASSPEIWYVLFLKNQK